MIALVRMNNWNGTVTTFIVSGRTYREIRQGMKRKVNGKRFRFTIEGSK